VQILNSPAAVLTSEVSCLDIKQSLGISAREGEIFAH